MKKIVIMMLLLASSSLFAAESKQEDIRTLLELTGAARLGIQIMNQMIEMYKQNMPNVPEKFWSDFMNEVKVEDLIRLIIPIYDKYFTHDDIKELIKFYNTPIGKKVITLLPEITRESISVGQEWGRALGERIKNRLEQGGYKL
jgi:hypothetical protein